MDDVLAKQIGDAARQARKARGLTQAEAAERIGVSVEFYARLERGGTLPSVSTLQKLSRTLSASADLLLGADGGRLSFPEPTAEERIVHRRNRLLRRVVRRLETSDEPTLNLVNQLLVGVERWRQGPASAGRRRSGSRVKG